MMKNEKREAAVELDNLQVQLRCAIELVAAVHDCMDSAPNDPKCYSDALFGAVQYLRTINEKMEALANALFEKEAGA